MSRRRMIEPGFWMDEKVGALSPRARLTYIALWTLAEDSGVGRAHMNYLKSSIFPYDDLSSEDFAACFEEIRVQEMVRLFEWNGQHYYQIPNFKRHQKLKHPLASKLPEIDSDGTVIPPKNVEIGENSAGAVFHRDFTDVAPLAGAIFHRDFPLIEEKRKEDKPTQEKYPFGSRRNVWLSERDCADLIGMMGEERLRSLIEKMSIYLASTGKQYEDYRANLIRWHNVGIRPKNMTERKTPLGEIEASLFQREEEQLI